MTNKYTREQILNMLESSQVAVERAILAIHARQTADEQRSAKTKHSNGRGWNAIDAGFATSLHRWIVQGQTRYKKQLGKCLMGGQVPAAKKLLRKYVGQLIAIANRES